MIKEFLVNIFVGAGVLMAAAGFVYTLLLFPGLALFLLTIAAAWLIGSIISH